MRDCHGCSIVALGLVFIVILVILYGCSSQVIKVPVDTRCLVQEAIILTPEEAKATPRKVLDRINVNNCALWLSCPDQYEAPAACSSSP